MEKEVINIINAVIAGVNDGVYIEVEGHADYAEYGKDIVCAAMSALMCAAVAELDELCNNGFLVCRGRAVTDGYICIDVVPADTDDGYSYAAMNAVRDMLKKGFEMLEELYPENVTAEY